MDDQVIKDEILDAEAVIRGLAQHMQDAVAVTQAAEAAKRSLSDATSALFGAAAQFEALRTLAQEAVIGVDGAARDLAQQSRDTLSTASGEITKGARDLLSARADLCSATETIAAATLATTEKTREVASALDTMSAKLATVVAEATSTVIESLSGQIKDARALAEKIESRVHSVHAEMRASFSKDDALLADLKKVLDKVGPGIDAMSSTLKGEIRSAHAKNSDQISAVETNVSSRMKAADRKLIWVIALQAITLATAAAVAIKFLIH